LEGGVEVLPECPDWLIAFANRGNCGSPIAPKDIDRPKLALALSNTTPPATQHTEAEEARLLSALAYIPARDRGVWLIVLMAIHRLGWGEKGFQIGDVWSRKCPEKYNEADQRKTWESFDRQYSGKPITVATIYALAKKHGCNDDATPKAPHDDAELERLARLSQLDYGRARKEAAKGLGIPVSILDGVVKTKRSELGLDEDDGLQGRAVEYEEPEPWPEPVGGAPLLDNLAASAKRFVVLPEHGAEIVALWTVHTYCMDATDVTPRLEVTAPEKGCGKSTLFDFLEQVVYRPDPVANITTAAFFRTVEQFRPTLLIDDLESFAREDSDIRNVLNTGHHIRGRVKRTVGDDHKVRAFSTFAALAYNHIGELPREYNTLVDRSITVLLARRLASEKIESLSGPRRRNEFADLRRKLKRFADDQVSALANAEPNMPSELVNRRADNWRPLLAIADAAGGG
jgi:putative DNA primase/helicase